MFIQDTNKILSLPAVIIWDVLDSVHYGTMAIVHLVLDAQFIISMKTEIMFSILTRSNMPIQPIFGHFIER